VTRGGRRYRLPKGRAGYSKKWPGGLPRGIREVVTERSLFNCHGTFYVLPRENSGGIAAIKPVCTHQKRISDFCSWRGLTVLAGLRGDVQPGKHVVVSDDGKAALWLGDIDDLWQLGKPRGHGGPWKETDVKAGAPSDAYLMTGFDEKRFELSHDANRTVTFTVEVDVTRKGRWQKYGAFDVAPGRSFKHKFPAGYSAHWVRVVADRDCRATALFTYE